MMRQEARRVVVQSAVLLSSLVLGFGVFSSALSAGAQGKETPIAGDPVEIDSGLVAGKLLPGGVKAYLGIPYAAPPIGDLRWREPRPVKAWAGVRKAYEYGNSCMQPHSFPDSPPLSEDCLYLNLWVPATSPTGKLPVIVYIVGTAYRNGTAAMPMLSGEALAKKGVIFLNFNYRLGLFGSLAHPDLTAESPYKASGGYVHMDEVAVVQWVHWNIARFGGDPDNVTLMGQSSGAIDVSYLQASPLVQGLIHRAVAFSGSTYQGGPWPAAPLKQAEQWGIEFQQRLGAKSLAEMRALPAEQLLKASSTEIEEPVGADGYVLSMPAPEIMAAHRQNDVPILLERCRDEGFSPLGSVKTIDEFKATVQRMAGAKADEVLKLYPVSSDSEAAATGMRAALDSSLGKMLVQWAADQSSAKAPAYISVFSYGAPGRAGHGSELPYYLNTISLPTPSGFLRNEPITPSDIELADKLSDVLVAFAKSGNPNTTAVHWPKFDPKDPHELLIGESFTAIPVDKGIFYFIANSDVRLSNITSPRR
jgi:para-nitrobenzyl esterase